MADSTLAQVDAPSHIDSRVDADLDEQGRQSFPASDPPSTWWGGSGDSPR